MPTTIVRYSTADGRADENQQLIEAQQSAFQAFTADIATRCSVPPTRGPATSSAATASSASRTGSHRA